MKAYFCFSLACSLIMTSIMMSLYAFVVLPFHYIETSIIDRVLSFPELHVLPFVMLFVATRLFWSDSPVDYMPSEQEADMDN